MSTDWECGTGVFTTVGLVLVTLKLSHSLTWPWWCVTFPLWLPMALFVVLGLVVGLLMILDGLLTSLVARRRADAKS